MLIAIVVCLWYVKPPVGLWAYRTSRSLTGATPFALVYGSEAFMLITILVFVACPATNAKFEGDSLGTLDF